jgi:hypothetical protein
MMGRQIVYGTLLKACLHRDPILYHIPSVDARLLSLTQTAQRSGARAIRAFGAVDALGRGGETPVVESICRMQIA